MYKTQNTPKKYNSLVHKQWITISTIFKVYLLKEFKMVHVKNCLFLIFLNTNTNNKINYKSIIQNFTPKDVKSNL